MAYVKKGALVLLVDDDQIAKYKADGFAVYTPPVSKSTEKSKADAKAKKEAVKQSKLEAEKAELASRAEALKLDLSDDLTIEQVREAVEKAEAEANG